MTLARRIEQLDAEITAKLTERLQNATHGPWILYFPNNASVSFATSQKTIEAISNKYVFLMSPRLPTIADAFFILPKMQWYKIGSRNTIALRNHVLQRYVARAAC